MVTAKTRRALACIAVAWIGVAALLHFWVVWFLWHPEQEECHCRGSQQVCSQCSFTVNSRIVVYARVLLMVIVALSMAAIGVVERSERRIAQATTAALISSGVLVLHLWRPYSFANFMPGFDYNEELCRDDDCIALVISQGFSILSCAMVAIGCICFSVFICCTLQATDTSDKKEKYYVVE